VQAVLASSNLHAAVKTLKNLSVAEMDKFLNSKALMEKLGLSNSEEKALINVLKKKETESKENYWV
jgi:hypothetical protein